VDGRRLAPAGQGFMVLVIALVFAALLNARGMHKTAAEQSPGAARDVALWLSARLVDVSSAFDLDEPRSALKSALGRSKDDTVDTQIRFARPAGGGGSLVAARALPWFTPAKPLRVYITGDSLVTDPASSFQDLARQSRIIDVLSVDPHAATGLAQPEIFDWFDYLPQQARQLRPNLVVITLGGNDGLDLSGNGGGQGFGTPAWRAEYGRRVGGVMDDFIGVGAKVVWLGLPITRDSDLATHYRAINQVDSEQARLRAGNVTFIDLYSRFADKHGQYSDYLPGVGGQVVHVRASDGIHYDTPGADIVAHAVARAIPLLVRLQTSDPDFASVSRS
jgi:lysophospholipase L1-like esterase